MNPFGRLNAMECLCQVEEVYKPPTHGAAPGSHAARLDLGHARYASIVAAYHQRLASGEPLVVTWYRKALGARVTVAVSTSSAGQDYPAALVFPPGARGRPITSNAVRADLGAIAWWVPVAGVVDALVPGLHPDLAQGGAEPLAGLEQSLLAAWHGPFAWLLLADPVRPGDMSHEAAWLADQESTARDHASNPEDLITAERLARRYREVSAGHSTGLWRVRLLAGGVDEPSAAAVAGLLVAGQDFRGTPYALIPHKPVHGLANAADAMVEQDGVTQVPFLADPHLLTTLAQIPATEIPGIRLVERSTFDVTPEHTTDTEDVLLGQVLDHDGLPAGPLRVGFDTLNRHAFVCGATGSGKSQTVRAVLEQLARSPRPVPWLVIEPAKAEYAGMARRLHDISPPVLAIRPGDPSSIPGCLNPLEPEPGFPLQTHIDLVRALFLAAFDAYEPFPQVLSHALDRAYRDLGWDAALGKPRKPGVTPRYPTLGELRDIALDVVENIGYSREITDNVRGFIDVRLGSLTLGTPGRFFHGGHALDLAQLLNRNTVLELEDIGNDQDQAFLIGAVLIRINEHLRQRHQQRKHDRKDSSVWHGQGNNTEYLRHVTVIEEAHRLLKKVEPGSPAAHAVELFATLLAEVRAYGEGIIVAEQIPTKITPDVVKNSALKIVHRLPAADDRDLVGATMNLTDEQSRYVVALPPGRAAVFAGGMDHPLLAQVPLGHARESDHNVDRTPGILKPRSPACPATCSSRPCTREEIGQAEHLIDDTPRLILWIELTTIALLTGQPKPNPERQWLDQLTADNDQHTLDCAIAKLIHDAVDTRYPGLVSYFQPEDLAGHLRTLCRHLLANEPLSGDRPETHWQAGQYRWFDVVTALVEADDSPDPHPDTEHWQRRGLRLPDGSCRQQLEALSRLPELIQNSLATYRGRTTPTYYEKAAAKLDPDPEPVSCLTRAIDFLNLDWDFKELLYPDTASSDAP
ncbi:ATP-binding protein [Actinocrispum wychmicini]|uniref:DNA helicase HerA-like ATPase n=1 Tax=Actinocrispum wychmicini TaxID=1213861 RepID=A0A4R2JZV3_9PSEU|nr:ATP-binding protein [Actinocrispum wychmicini]TCO62849.1 DNA helicase HerA-like ATPase [Actinocrispum wychmicini]